jgi:hypothetical protein
MSWQKFYATFFRNPRVFQIFSWQIGKIAMAGNQESSQHCLNRRQSILCSVFTYVD